MLQNHKCSLVKYVVHTSSGKLLYINTQKSGIQNKIKCFTQRFRVFTWRVCDAQYYKNINIDKHMKPKHPK